MKNDSMIIWQDNKTPKSRYFDDVYFNTQDAIAETKYVFIEGNQLLERFLLHERDTFYIAETGFGTGLNFLILWQFFLQFRQNYPKHPLKYLHFYSVEKYPMPKDELTLIYQSILFENHLKVLSRQLAANYSSSQHNFSEVFLSILFDDVSQFAIFLKQKETLIDAWFFDGFSPKKNPLMWTEELFSDYFKLTNNQGSFATFTAAGFVKRHLIKVGFNVQKRKGYGCKREMLVGFKN